MPLIEMLVTEVRDSNMNFQASSVEYMEKPRTMWEIIFGVSPEGEVEGEG